MTQSRFLIIDPRLSGNRMRNYSVQLVKLSFIIDLEENLRFVVRSKIVNIKRSVRVLELRSI